MAMTYFQPGEEVTLKQENTGAPVMVVKNIKRAPMRSENREEKKSDLMGVVCFWFTSHGLYQEQLFNTKDLVKVVE